MLAEIPAETRQTIRILQTPNPELQAYTPPPLSTSSRRETPGNTASHPDSLRSRFLPAAYARASTGSVSSDDFVNDVKGAPFHLVKDSPQVFTQNTEKGQFQAAHKGNGND